MSDHSFESHQNLAEKASKALKELPEEIRKNIMPKFRRLENKVEDLICIIEAGRLPTKPNAGRKRNGNKKKRFRH